MHACYPCPWCSHCVHLGVLPTPLSTPLAFLCPLQLVYAQLEEEASTDHAGTAEAQRRAEEEQLLQVSAQGVLPAGREG